MIINFIHFSGICIFVALCLSIHFHFRGTSSFHFCGTLSVHPFHRHFLYWHYIVIFLRSQAQVRDYSQILSASPRPSTLVPLAFVDPPSPKLFFLLVITDEFVFNSNEFAVIFGLIIFYFNNPTFSSAIFSIWLTPLQALF